MNRDFKSKEEVEWKDALGNDLVVGDCIAYGALRGSIVTLQIGKIIELRAKEYRNRSSAWTPSIQVQGIRREWDGKWTKMKKSVIFNLEGVLSLGKNLQAMVMMM